MKLGTLAAIMAAALACANSAAASVVTQTYTMTGSNFSNYWGPLPAPIDPLTAKIVVTYDTTVENTPTNVGVTVKGLNFSPVGPTEYAFNPAGFGYMAFGTAPSQGAGFSILGPGYYGFQLWNIFSANPQMGYAQYRTSSGNYYTFSGTLSISDSAGGVPEPGAWAMLILGLAIIGAGLRMSPGKARRCRHAALM